jgi:hypothetical protein
MLNMRKQSTWEKILLIIAGFAFTFSLAAILLTVILLNSQSGRETMSWASAVYSSYGLFWGAILEGLTSFFIIIGIPMLLWLFKSFINKMPRFSLKDFFVLFILAFIDGYIICYFAATALDMSNDFIVFSSVFAGTPKTNIVTGNVLIYVQLLVFVSVLFASVLMRTQKSRHK